MKHKIIVGLVFCCMVSLSVAQKKANSPMKSTSKVVSSPKKAVVYQVFTRLFGNKNTTNKPWGTIEEMGRKV